LVVHMDDFMITCSFRFITLGDTSICDVTFEGLMTHRLNPL
jgi:hypothetical protein